MLDGCRGIELEPGDIGRALDEMKRAGAVLLKSSHLSPEALTPAATLSDGGSGYAGNTVERVTSLSMVCLETFSTVAPTFDPSRPTIQTC
jgi:hypothetical protein